MTHFSVARLVIKPLVIFSAVNLAALWLQEELGSAFAQVICATEKDDYYCPGQAPGPFAVTTGNFGGCHRSYGFCIASAATPPKKKCAGTFKGYYGKMDCQEATAATCTEVINQTGVVGVYVVKCGKGCVCTVKQQTTWTGTPVTQRVDVDECTN